MAWKSTGRGDAPKGEQPAPKTPKKKGRGRAERKSKTTGRTERKKR